MAPISFPGIVTYNCRVMVPNTADLPNEVVDRLCGKKRVEKDFMCRDDFKKARVDGDRKGGQLQEFDKTAKKVD